ncbi:MAG TPA: cytochrome c-type biogenesis protein CcmH [Oligoflexia bacterium]|nr:cytochrome c-type biogenesis protein CcmH [Oligoflexia bacterium]
MVLLSCVQAQLPELNSEQEKRAQAIDKLLMAPCCWAKTVAEDNSGMAFGVREQVRTLILAGKSDAEVLAYFEAEYGEKILSSPKKEDFNLLLWILPFILMPLLMFGVYKIILSWRTSTLSEGQKSAAQAPFIEEKIVSEQDKQQDKPNKNSQEYAKYAKQLDQELYGDDS